MTCPTQIFTHSHFRAWHSSNITEIIAQQVGALGQFAFVGWEGPGLGGYGIAEHDTLIRQKAANVMWQKAEVTWAEIEQFDGIGNSRTVVFAQFGQLSVRQYGVGCWHVHVGFSLVSRIA